MNMHKQSTMRNFFGKYNNFVLMLLIIFFLNAVGVGLFKRIRIDLTKHDAYSLSKISKKVVRNLADPVRIRVFFSKNLPSPHNDTERYLRDLLSEYSIAANKNFKYEFYDCTESKGEDNEKIKKNIQTASDYGIYPVQIRKIEKDEVQLIKAYMGVVIQNGDIIEKISPLESTARLEYRITGIIEKMNNKISYLIKVPGKINVKLYLSSSLQMIGPFMRINGMGELPSKIKKAVEAKNQEFFGKLQFSHLDYTVNPEIEKEVDALALRKPMWDSFIDQRTGTRIQAGSGCAALVVEHNGKTEVLELINVINMPIFGTQYQLEDMENIGERLKSIVDSLLAINEKIAYLEGKGCVSIDTVPDNPYMQQMNPNAQAGEGANFGKMLGENYNVERIKASDLTADVPVLIIAGPKENFSEYELFILDQYIMQGKSVALFMDGLEEMAPPQQQYGYPQPPTYRPLSTGIEKLLMHYGVQVHPAYVMDKSCYEQINNPQMGKQILYFAPIIQAESINEKLDFLKNIKGFITLKISPLELDNETIKNQELTVRTLFSSSKNAWEMRDRIMLHPMYIQPPADSELKQIPLAYVLEGQFNSYFADKGIPEKDTESDAGKDNNGNKDDQKVFNKVTAQNQLIKKGKPAKIFITGTSDMIKNNLIDTAADGPNSLLVMNIIDYMYGKSDWAVMRAKSQKFNPLKPYDDKGGVLEKLFTNRSRVKVFNIVLVPVFVILCGLIVYRNRQRRKREIMDIFM